MIARSILSKFDASSDINSDGGSLGTAAPRKIERVYFLAAGVWAILVYSGWSGAQFILGGLVDFVPPVETHAALGTTTTWLPLAVDVAGGTLFPVAPSTAAGGSGLAIYPYLTLWLHGLLIFLFGLPGAHYFGEAIVPTVGLLLFVSVVPPLCI